jgi:hypothetical protein
METTLKKFRWFVLLALVFTALVTNVGWRSLAIASVTSSKIRVPARPMPGATLPPLPQFPNSVWTQKVPSSPQTSSTLQAQLEEYGAVSFRDYDFDQTTNYSYYPYLPLYLWAFDPPAYWASSTDHQWYLSCPYGCQILEAARPQMPRVTKYGNYNAPWCPGVCKDKQFSGTDSQVIVISPDGTSETDLAGAENLYLAIFSGGLPTASVYGGTSLQTALSNGFVPAGYGNATASGRMLAAGMILRSELTTKNGIQHALALGPPCVDTGANVFPATHSAGSACASGQGLPQGARLWLDLPDSTINGFGLDTGTTNVLLALSHYGGYVTDTLGGTISDPWTLAHSMLNPLTWTDRGLADPYPALAAHNGWPCLPYGQCYTFGKHEFAIPLSSVPSIAANLYVLDPCVTQKNCPLVSRRGSSPEKTMRGNALTENTP